MLRIFSLFNGADHVHLLNITIIFNSCKKYSNSLKQSAYHYFHLYAHLFICFYVLEDEHYMKGINRTGRECGPHDNGSARDQSGVEWACHRARAWTEGARLVGVCSEALWLGVIGWHVLSSTVGHLLKTSAENSETLCISERKWFWTTSFFEANMYAFKIVYTIACKNGIRGALQPWTAYVNFSLAGWK